jgi:hypothetical protein
MSLANKDGRLDSGEIAIGQSTTGDVTGFAAGTGTAVVSGSKWAGKPGATAYTVGDIVTALKKIGVLAP